MPASPRDRASYWRATTSLGEVQLLRAHFVRQHFSRHAHEGYGVGVIERGAMAFDYMGESQIAASGQVNLVVPGEPHDGHAAMDDGWVYRMFYLDAETLRRVASELDSQPRDLPYFQSGVIGDPTLARRLQATHRLFEREDVTSLERDSALLSTLAAWVRRYGDDARPIRELPAAQDAVERVREQIASEYGRPLQLDELANAAGLSPYHMLRVFKQATGLSPHLYLCQTRVRRARDLIRAGTPLAAVAQEVGLSDQSHLNRQFKRVLGITPGQYRKIVQD